MKRKLIALLLCASVLVSSTIASAETQEITTPSSATTNVTYSQAASFSVMIAKEIVLDETKAADYTVEVIGDLASDDTLSVTPIDEVDTSDGINFLMSDQAEVEDKKADVVATVTQDKTEWTFSNIETDANGTIQANDLSAGNWKGILTFNINVTRESDKNNNEEPENP